MKLTDTYIAGKRIARYHLNIAYKRAAARVVPDLRQSPALHAYPEVTILVTTYNCRYPLELTLRSLREHTSYPNYHLIIADNGSTDGTLEFLESLVEAGWPLFLRQGDLKPQWSWYDDMIQEVETPYWVGLHQDMYFISGDWLAELIFRMEKEQDILLLSGERSPRNPNATEPIEGGIVDLQEKPSTWILCARRELRNHIDSSFDNFKRRDPETGKLQVFEHGGKFIEDMRAKGLRYEWMPPWYALRWQHIENLSWAFNSHIKISNAQRSYKLHQIRDAERRAKALRT